MVGSQEAVRAHLALGMELAGPRCGGLVVDVADGAEVVGQATERPLPLASVAKLLTTATALRRHGPEHRLRTEVLGDLGPGGTATTLHLRGAGDETLHAGRAPDDLERSSVDDLAAQLVAAGVRRVAGPVLGDEERYDLSRRTRRGPVPDPDLDGVLGALLVDRGRGRPSDPAGDAAAHLTAALDAAGTVVDGVPRAGPAAPGMPVLAAVTSPSLTERCRRVNLWSDNLAAELMLKELAAGSGRCPGTTAAGAAEVALELATLGVTADVVDGSGLDRRAEASPRAVVQLLLALRGTPAEDALRRGLPVAGQSGSLARRMRGTPAEGRCWAKTGRLAGTANLAGWCRTQDSRLLVFAFLVDGLPEAAGRRLIDEWVAALAALDGP